jgi:calcineurin-like phosphoesterase family protein
MQVFFASDTHFGHKSIVKLGQGLRPGADSEEHDEILIRNWNRMVGPKRTMVFLLGDVAMSWEGYQKLERLNGQIRILLGNHDDRWLGPGRDLHRAAEWLPPRIRFEPVSLLRYKRMWLSHCPIHPDEMRKCVGNVHGHIHNHTIDDPRYLNVCMERLPGFAPISLDRVREIFKERGIDAQS